MNGEASWLRMRFDSIRASISDDELVVLYGMFVHQYSGMEKEFLRSKVAIDRASDEWASVGRDWAVRFDEGFCRG